MEEDYSFIYSRKAKWDNQNTLDYARKEGYKEGLQEAVTGWNYKRWVEE